MSPGARGLKFRSGSALQVQLGVLDFEKRRCVQFEDVYGAVVCPEGFFKVAKDVFDSKCTDLGGECGIFVDDLICPPPRVFYMLFFGFARGRKSLGILWNFVCVFPFGALLVLSVHNGLADSPGDGQKRRVLRLSESSLAVLYHVRNGA